MVYEIVLAGDLLTSLPRRNALVLSQTEGRTSALLFSLAVHRYCEFTVVLKFAAAQCLTQSVSYRFRTRWPGQRIDIADEPLFPT